MTHNSLQHTLHLAKQNFKFSAAHFLIFDENHAERLHGHNYQVKVEALAGSQKKSQSDLGYVVDFNVLKKIIKARLDEWDEVILLPAANSEMKIKENGPSLEIKFRDRFYVFPKNEVKLLPITNTSVEELSRLLAEDLGQKFRGLPLKKLRVYVEETRGQGASTTLTLV